MCRPWLEGNPLRNSAKGRVCRKNQAGLLLEGARPAGESLGIRERVPVRFAVCYSILDVVEMNKLKQMPGLVVEELDDEILLYRPSTHKAIHLNETAAAIWKLCDGTRTVKDLVDCLLPEFPSAEARISHEVQETIELLLRDGALVERLPESSS